MNISNIETLVTDLCRYLENSLLKEYPSTDTRFSFSKGKKYWKVYQYNINNKDKSMSVHAFIDPTNGNIYKAAGWASPANGVRYNIFENNFLDRVKPDPYGSYLYNSRYKNMGCELEDLESINC